MKKLLGILVMGLLIQIPLQATSKENPLKLFKKEILLIIIGGVFVLEVMSVIIQVCYYKITKHKTGKGKRYFKMAPLHHHFELLGWHENQVVVRFWIIGIIFSIISLTSFKIQ